MSDLQHLAYLVGRQVAAAVNGSATGSTVNEAAGIPACAPENDFDGRIGLRVSAIFVILVGSLFGAVFPVYANRHRGIGVPEWAFFIAKYFGSGVIIATAFIHLLAPASSALTNLCLTGPITSYDWAEGIALMMTFILFFVELMAMRFSQHSHSHPDTHDPEHHLSPQPTPPPKGDAHFSPESNPSHTPGDDHLSHTRTHTDLDSPSSPGLPAEDYAAQMTAIFILEFGVIFHSIFVGLTLAVAGAEFTILYVVLTFHQTFEGLGLGSRLAVAPFPASKKWTPYYLAVGYAVTTPASIAVGLGVRRQYAPGSETALVVNGVFDAISAGILIYTGLVELMAHEFMFTEAMRRAELKVVLSAFGMMCLGAGLMALLGKWA
ncbi:MAG: plasma membrane low affinity zinc ion [Lasallia pustulata]|uniref:Plasma membrane low affinity zinc ion n=1 Tax=Lasallia pustulata TaxID=136370 RepID=A0A5M8PN69_9LECA|nr:MAG: plasma membrane low affinity zinc ion [Lasallia pustulata]